VIIAIDTSSAVSVIGIGDTDGPGPSARAEGSRRHAEEIDTLFASTIAPALTHQAQVRAVAVGIGPGPYSGLRVGIAFGIGLARAWNVPVIGVCSLDVRAWQVVDTGTAGDGSEFAVAADARRHEVYWARYRNAGLLERTAGPTVVESLPDELVFHEIEIDPAAMAVRVARFMQEGCTPQQIDADFVAHGDDASNFSLGPGPLFTATPLYLRKPDVTISATGTP